MPPFNYMMLGGHARDPWSTEIQDEPVLIPTEGGGGITEEREGHIAERHPDLLPEHRARLVETLAAPDQGPRSAFFGSARLFSRFTLMSPEASI